MESISSGGVHAGSRRKRPATRSPAEDITRSPLADLTNAPAAATASASVTSSSSLLPLLQYNRDPKSNSKPKRDFGDSSDAPRLPDRPSSSITDDTLGGTADENGGRSSLTPSMPKSKKPLSGSEDVGPNGSIPEMSVIYSRRASKGKGSRKKRTTAESSCPPLGRTSTKREKLVMKETDAKRLKACSVPYGKRKKKREYELPKDFIEKQKAYFDEIDAFELPEEEVSETELD